jgi:hypothetical protein
MFRVAEAHRINIMQSPASEKVAISRIRNAHYSFHIKVSPALTQHPTFA